MNINGKRKPAMKPYAAYATASFIVVWAGLMAMAWGPPLIGPTMGPWAAIIAMLVFYCLVAGVGCLIAGFVARQRMIWALALVVGIYIVERATYPDVDGLWRQNFERTKSERVRLTSFLRMREPNSRGTYDIPQEYRDVADGFAVRLVDAKRRRFFTHAAFTTGSDNVVAFCWSESGAPPPENALFEVVRFEPLGDGWFLLYTT